MQRIARVAAVAAAAFLATGVTFGLSLASARAQDGAKPAAPADGKKADAKVVIPFFGNAKCPIQGKAINPTKYVEADGQRAYFCCGGCVTKAKADPKAAIASAYKEPKAVGNKKCPVSGHAIDDKGKEVTWQGQKVMLCCGDCVEPFNKSPFLYTTAAVYGAEDLKNKNCPVMKVLEGEDEASDPSTLAVYQGKIVRLCCSECVPKFEESPDKFMGALSGK